MDLKKITANPQMLGNILLSVIAGVEGATNKERGPNQTVGVMNRMNDQFSSMQDKENELKRKAIEEKTRAQQDEITGLNLEQLKTKLAKERAASEEEKRLQSNLAPTPLTDKGRQAVFDEHLLKNKPEEYFKTQQANAANSQKQQKEYDKQTRDDKNKLASNAMDLRKEYSKESDDYKQVRDQVKRYESIIKNNDYVPTGASDMALIFTYMKSLDPRSTVREGEYATAQQAGGVPSYVLSLYNKVVGGGQLDEKGRNEISSAMSSQYGAMLTQQQEREKSYREIAQEVGINPDLVVKHIRAEPVPVFTKPKQDGVKPVDLNKFVR
jgi:hypothetical protein